MASANLYLDRTKTNSDGLAPICIRICHLRKQWMVGLKMYASHKDYEKATTEKGTLTDAQKALRDTLLEKRQKAQTRVNGLDVATKDTFNQAFFAEVDIVKISQLVDMKSQVTAYIEEMKKDDRIKSAKWYNSAMLSLLDYKPNRNLQEIDKKYLSGYKLWMKSQGNSADTAKMYLRALRSIFNRAIKAKLIHEKYYPFKDYSCKGGTKSESVLYPEQVEKLLEYGGSNKAQRRIVDYWFFSFLANGMNPRDIFSLRWKDLKGDKLTFQRHKTERTKKESDEITLYLHQHALEIIKRHGNAPTKDGYIFPLFNDCHTEEERYAGLEYWKRQANTILNRIGTKLGFDDLNTGIARHSLGTALAMQNVNLTVISKMLGHSKIETTMHYVKSLPDEAMKDINMNILPTRTVLKAV